MKKFQLYIGLSLILCCCNVNDKIEKANESIEKNMNKQIVIDKQFEKLRQLRNENTPNSTNLDTLSN